MPNLAERLEGLSVKAKQVTDAKGRSIRAAKLHERSKRLEAHQKQLEELRKVRAALEKELATGVECPPSSDDATLRSIAAEYVAGRSWETKVDEGEPDWRRLDRELRIYSETVTKALKASLEERRRRCLAGVSVADLTQLGTVPGLEASARDVGGRRSTLENTKFDTLDFGRVVRFVEQVNEYWRARKELSAINEVMPPSVLVFCEHAKGGGAAMSMYTDEVREWFEKNRRTGLLRISFN